MLTTKRFIKEVKAMGLVAKVCDEYILIDDFKGRYLAYIYTEVMYKFNILYDSFQELSESNRKRLFNLLVEYASTPSDEREEPQKFYMEFKIEPKDSCRYLNYSELFNSIELNNKTNLNGFQTQFTQKEIDNIKKKFGVTLSDFEQIPIEEDEE
ncbi:MAG: hypothetical protein ACLVME_06050 [Ezakiella coagulans]|uniref:hypothetical protein n=1 Tax=Ezakiella coagulans TaxID=46507 RepID=UPI00399BEA1F